MENLVIVGGGISGLTAAIYAARASLNPLVVEGKEPGGQLMWTTLVENFPCFPDGILGPDMMSRSRQQAKRFGARFKAGEVTSFKKADGHYELFFGEEKLEAKSIIIATGASARWTGLPSEAKFKSKGIHTCATCDGYFYKDKVVFVVGGGDSAMEEASFLSKIAKKVTIVHRKDSLRASDFMQERIKKLKNVDFMWNSEISEFKGDDMLSSVMIKDNKSGEVKEHKVDGVFLAIGHIPNIGAFKDIVELDKFGLVKTDERGRTNLPGVFASGDVQDHLYRQAITSAGSGCRAAMEAERYLDEVSHAR